MGYARFVRCIRKLLLLRDNPDFERSYGLLYSAGTDASLLRPLARRDDDGDGDDEDDEVSAPQQQQSGGLLSSYLGTWVANFARSFFWASQKKTLELRPETALEKVVVAVLEPGKKADDESEDLNLSEASEDSPPRSPFFIPKLRVLVLPREKAWSPDPIAVCGIEGTPLNHGVKHAEDATMVQNWENVDTCTTRAAKDEAEKSEEEEETAESA